MKRSELRDIARHFRLTGAFLRGTVWGRGHIHDTYQLTCEAGGERVRYLLQRINTNVFRDPVGLMDNVSRVTQHLRSVLEASAAPDLERRCLTVIPTRDDEPLHRDANGAYWRVYRFVEGAFSLETLENEAQARAAGRAFGEFQVSLEDLTGPRLVETIPEFHVTPLRVRQLEEAVTADVAGRAARASTEIALAREHAAMADVLHALHRKGEIPERITHNDTKLDNVLFDLATRRALCVVDLDTVMPGLALHDFGDLVRSCASEASGGDLDRVQLDLDVFEAVARGYLEATALHLTSAEIAHLAFAPRLIAYELGVRFLTDYLSGDRYFKTARPGHNLHRCRVQFALVESMHQQERAMQRVVQGLIHR